MATPITVDNVTEKSENYSREPDVLSMAMFAPTIMSSLGKPVDITMSIPSPPRLKPKGRNVKSSDPIASRLSDCTTGGVMVKWYGQEPMIDGPSLPIKSTPDSITMLLSL